MDKKASVSIDDLPKVSMMFLLAAVFFVIAIVIVTNIGDNTNFSPLTTAGAEAFTMPTDEGNITTSEYYVVAVTFIKNATGGTYPAANYTLTNTGVNSGAKIQLHENASVCKTGATCYVTYTFNDHGTAQGTVVTNTLTALTEIPNNWLLLIAVVVAASIVVGIVISNLGNKGMRT